MCMSNNPYATINVIITGSTGMVGEGVLIECLAHPYVGSVLVINRRPCGYSHRKLKEVIHEDFFNLTSIEQELTGYNACFFCLGVSSVGMKESQYTKLTYDLTIHFAQSLCRLNNGMNFCYVSGAGTDSSEKGKSMWARVKGKTENDLMKLPFDRVIAFRPGFLKASKGQHNTLSIYKWLGWIFPIGRALYKKGFCTLRELGLAMIHTNFDGYDRKVLEGDEIIELAARDK